jgi:hypothetical protein
VYCSPLIASRINSNGHLAQTAVATIKYEFSTDHQVLTETKLVNSYMIKRFAFTEAMQTNG